MKILKTTACAMLPTSNQICDYQVVSARHPSEVLYQNYGFIYQYYRSAASL